MHIRFRFLCVDMPEYSGLQEVDVFDGATVEQALAAHAEQNNIENSLWMFSGAIYLIGKDPARLDTVLRDEDEVYVMRLLHGG